MIKDMNKTEQGDMNDQGAPLGEVVRKVISHEEKSLRPGREGKASPVVTGEGIANEKTLESGTSFSM